MSHCRFVGYDRRAAIDVADPQWTADRRDRFLYNPHIFRPLSVDTMVWQRVQAPNGQDFHDNRPHPAFFDLFGTVPGHPVAPKTCVIAIAVLCNGWSAPQRENWDGLVLDRDHRPIGLETLERQPEWPPAKGRWEFLGFDIADAGLVSGLTNCGFVPHESVDPYRERWSAALNKHHLFDDHAAASDFAAFADERVPEHAPFYAYGIWTMKG